MKMMLSWKPPESIRRREKWANFKASCWLAARISMLVLVVGFGFWWLALIWIPKPVMIPWKLHKLVSWIIVGHALYFWLIPLYLLFPKRYIVNRFNLNGREWREFIAFDVDADEKDPSYDRLILWRKALPHRQSSVALPEDARLSRLIVKYVARNLTHIDRHEKAEELRSPIPIAPGWFTPSVFLIVLGYALAVGWFGAWLIETSRLDREMVCAIVMWAAMIHPGWGVAWMIGRTAKNRRIRNYFWAVASVVSLVSVLVSLVAMIVFTW